MASFVVTFSRLQGPSFLPLQYYSGPWRVSPFHLQNYTLAIENRRREHYSLPAVISLVIRIGVTRRLVCCKCPCFNINFSFRSFSRIRAIRCSISRFRSSVAIFRSFLSYSNTHSGSVSTWLSRYNSAIPLLLKGPWPFSSSQRLWSLNQVNAPHIRLKLFPCQVKLASPQVIPSQSEIQRFPQLLTQSLSTNLS